VNELQMTGVAWRSDGFWTLLWLRIWFYLTSGRRRSFPPPGFVGVASTSLVATDHRSYKLLSTRMRQEAFTPGARLWRLTCVWAMCLPPSRSSRRGFG